jgi:hypothetical protein
MQYRLYKCKKCLWNIPNYGYGRDFSANKLRIYIWSIVRQRRKVDRKGKGGRLMKRGGGGDGCCIKKRGEEH